MAIKADLKERDARYKRLREAMESEGLDALVVAGYGGKGERGYIRYLADTHVWEGDPLILFPLEGEPVHVHVTYAAASMPDKLWIDDYRIWPEPQSEIIKAIKEKKLAGAKIGVAGMRKLVPAGVMEDMKSSLPKVKFTQADNVMDRVRAVKSALEIKQLREHWKMTQRAMERFIEVVGPGMSQREAAAEPARIFRAAGVFDDLTTIQEGNFKGLPRDTPLKCDDAVSFHLELCGESGHWSEINVICAFKPPSKLEQKLLDSERRALDEVRVRAKPGVTLSELAKTFDSVVLEDGWKFDKPMWHYYFHGQGMDGIEWPFFTAMPYGSQDTPLEEGMVFSYHPHRDTIPSVPAHRAPRIFDGFVITKRGAETLAPEWDVMWRIMK
jgi:Xaa-Pro aminopeptidase